MRVYFSGIGDAIRLRVIVRENQAGGQRWGSAKIFHTNIIDRLGGLKDKYTKVCSSSVCPFTSDKKHELRSLDVTVFAGCQIWVKFTRKLGPEGVIESGPHISYTKTLEEQTLVYLSIGPPNLSMMLVWNNLADPHLSAFSDFAWFSQTVTLKNLHVSLSLSTAGCMF